MKYLFFLIVISCFVGCSSEAKKPINFDTEFYYAINKYVAFPSQGNSSSYAYGVIYVDTITGMNFDFQGNFILDKENQIITHKQFPSNTLKLDDKTSEVYVLDETFLSKLGLKSKNKWLDEFTENQNNPNYLKKIGSVISIYGGHKAALPLLEKAYNLSPDLQGLAYELSYVYNSLGQQEQAIRIIEDADYLSKNDHQLYRELAYAKLKQESYDEAEIAFNKSFEKETNPKIVMEASLAMLDAYHKEKNKKKFKYWSSFIKKLPANTEQIAYVDSLSASLN